MERDQKDHALSGVGRIDAGPMSPTSGDTDWRRRASRWARGTARAARSVWPHARGRALVLRHTLAPALLLALLGTALWAGCRVYDGSYLWYNTNRIHAAAERAARAMHARDTDEVETVSDPATAPIVVPLGDAALRNATLDERAMAALADRHGLQDMEFLRIVHDHAQFADFAPMLKAVLEIKPSLPLIDSDLLFTRRPVTSDLWHYATVLKGAALDGQPYLPDEVARQYEKNRPTATEDAARAVAAWRDPLDVSTESPAFDRVKRFIETARADGVVVALVHPRRSPAMETLLYGGGAAFPPGALDRLATLDGVPLWRFPDRLHRAGYYRGDGTLNAEGRRLYSAWLVSDIADALVAKPVEQAALR